MRTFKDYSIITLKGMAMGIADVVPGVSGGTIAFISGIYEELIGTIGKVNLDALRTLMKHGVVAFWKHINGNFLLALLSGIFISILSLAQLISWLLVTHPVLVWAFFFGLVLASIPLVAKKVKVWSSSRYFAFAAGAIMAFLITELPPIENSNDEWYIFIAGGVAICAMILPGISGSFILVLMGAYLTILDALNNRDIVIIIIFMAGAVVGLLIFSRLLKWMFERFHDITIAVLSGFLLGSLNKIWPWKHALQTMTKHAGEANEKTIALVEENLMPWDYAEITGADSQAGMAALLAVIGIGIIYVLERVAVKKA